MRIWLLVSVLCAASCSFTRANPDYCERNDQCPTGSACDPLRHLCRPPDLGIVLNSVEPPVGQTDGGTPITLRGQNFRDGMTILVNGVPTGLVAVSPAGDSATTVAPFSGGTCGAVSVRATNPDGSFAESANLFRYRLGTVRFFANSSALVNTSTPTVSLSAADTRGAGWNDVVALNSGAQSSVRILQTNPSGQLMPGNAFLSSGAYVQVFTANLNRDDYPDLLTLRPTGAGAVSFWLGSSGGGFVESLILNSTYKAVGVIDVNRDGLQDLILSGQNTLGVYRNSSTAGVAAFIQVTGNQPNGLGNYLAAADFDGNAVGDVAVFSMAGLLAVSFGDGNFGFPTTITIPAGVNNAGFLTATDIDQDGLMDLLLVDPLARVLSVVRNLGNRQFAPPTTFGVSGQPDLVQVADVDCDGLPDVIFAQRGTSIFVVQRNRGVMPYFDAVETATAVASDSIATFIAARFDQDNLIDLAMVGASGMQNMAYTLRNSSQ